MKEIKSDTKPKDLYNPTDKEKESIKAVYNDLEYMRKLRNQKYKYFNDRTVKDFIDDSQLRLNGFVPTRESQGKEKWQSNVFHPITQNKFKAMLAAIALDVPQIRITAQNDNQYRDITRAEIIENLVDFSYNQDNKEEQIFFEAWEAAEKGTVIIYDGFLKAKAKRNIIKSYNPTTGEIEFDEEDVETDNQCVNFIVPLMNLYIKDFQIFDIQKQPSLCWVERMDVNFFQNEFGKYKNADKVKTSNELTDKNESDTFFKEFWQEREKNDEPIEVIRYFNKGEDKFKIIANGVLLFEAPLILGKKKKWYPFAKTVFQPLASDFFYGNSLPNTLMGEQDVINSLFNMALDKTYKSMAPALLIGNTNKDDFDLEDQNTTIDTKIYVQDINQVREMPITGISQSDVKMIDIVARGLDLSSVDANQQGIVGNQTGGNATAREIVIANENAKKLKGIMYLFLTSLWLQKVKLRIMNILIYYTQPKMIEVSDSDKGTKTQEIYQMFTVENAELSDGSKGTLGIQIVRSQEELPNQTELDIEEQKRHLQSGEKFEMMALSSDYLDDWVYDVKIESDSIYQKESGLTQTKMEEKLRMLGTYFPEVIMQNKEKLSKDTLIAYEDDPDEYELTPMPQPQIDPATGMPMEPAMAGITGVQQGTPQVQGQLPKLGKF
jgi:hypothetical protein